MNSVNHEDRRRLIAETAKRIIGEEGIDAATVRRIATELDCSTRAITHYFPEKDELLYWAYEVIALQGQSDFAGAAQSAPTDLVGALEAMTAGVNEKNTGLWKVYVAFWAKAARDPAFAQVQQKKIEHARGVIASVIRARNPEREDSVDCARLLIALVSGISVHALMEPSAWPSEIIRAALEGHIANVLGPPTCK